MTIMELWSSSDTTPFAEVVDELTNVEGFDFLTTGSDTINDSLLVFYGERELFNDDSSYNKLCIKSLMKMNQYKYHTLFNTMGLDYNPIENYSMVESEELEHSQEMTGKKVDTSTKNGSVNTETNNETTVNGTITRGNVIDKVTNTMGARTSNDTQNNNKYAFNSGKESPTTTNYKTLEEGGYTDTSTTTRDSVIDKTTNNDVLKGDVETTENVNVSGESTNTESVGGASKKTLTRSGNIGVTTSQEMIESERNLARFSFYKEIAHDIARTIAWGVY